MTGLRDQWLDPRVPNVDPVHLERRGVSFDAAQKVGGVRFGKGGWWVLPAYVDPPSIWRIVDDPVLLDFVRFDPDSPDQWEAVTGDGVMLGEAAYEEARDDDLPLPVFRNPLHWLQAGGAGVFPLDLPRFAIAVMGYPPMKLQGEDIEHGRWLRSLADRLPKIDAPRIYIPEAA